MMYLVTACFDNQTSHALDRIIDDTAEFTGNDFMTANHIPAHLTLLQFHSKADVEKIISVFENAFFPDYKIDVSFKKCQSEIPHVLYVSVVNEKLMKFNKMFSDSFSLLDETIISPHYCPEKFYPHVSLAKRLEDFQRKKGIEFMKELKMPASGKIASIVLTEGKPPKKLSEISLT